MKAGQILTQTQKIQMNSNEKRKYLSNYKRLTKSLIIQFRPKIKAALQSQIRQFTSVYKDHPHVTPQIITSKNLKKSLINLHVTGAIKNGKLVKRELVKEIRKSARENDVWAYAIRMYLEKHGLDKVTFQITDTLKKQITKVLLQADADGWGIDKTVRFLDDAPFLTYMTERIVRTELAKATNTGAMVAAASSKILLNKQWLSADDNRTRRIPRNDYDHLHMNGVQVGFNDKFVVPSLKIVEALDFPGDPTASAGNVCNCRCTVVFVPIRDKNGKVVRVDTENPKIGNDKNVFYQLLQDALMIGAGSLLSTILNTDK